MKMIQKAILLILCLTALGCSRIAEQRKRRNLDVLPVTIVPSQSVALSNCLISFKAESETVLLRDDDFRFLWKVDGEVMADGGKNQFTFSRAADTEETVDISVEIESDEYFGTAHYSLQIQSHPFRNPKDSRYSFSEKPVLERGENQFIDPGSTLYFEGQFHSFYNAIVRSPVIYTGYAVSEDGLDFQKLRGFEDPLLTREDIIDITGGHPSNIHMKSVVVDDGIWTAYFTAVVSNTFYGRIFRAVSPDPLGPWVVDAEPVILTDHETWEGHYIGLPQVFKVDDDHFRMYFVTTGGDAGFAESPDGIHWEKHPEPLFQSIRPCFIQTDWGWVCISQENIYLSLDGIEWHRYSENLYSAGDAQDRGIVINWVTAAFVLDHKYYCYIEGGSTSTGSDVFLVSWEE